MNSGTMQIFVVLNLGSIHFIYEQKQSDHQQTYQLSHVSLFLLCLGHKEYEGHHMLIDLQVCVGNKVHPTKNLGCSISQ